MITTACLSSPEVLLASLFFENQPRRELYLVCAPSGAGKTTWLLELYSLARQQGRTTGGLLSPPVYADGQKMAIDLLDAASGRRMRLAARREQECGAETGGPDALGWVFDPAAIQWGNRVLSRTAACDLFFLDELGPLEWLYGQGLVQGFAALERGSYRAAFVSVRPSLLEQAAARWPRANVLEASQ